MFTTRYKNPIRHILTRHEQGAIHAAEGYARVLNKPCCNCNSDRELQLSHWNADAIIDPIPLVIFTGQVATNVIGSDAFQEADIMNYYTTTKHNYQVQDVNDIPRIVKEALYCKYR